MSDPRPVPETDRAYELGCCGGVVRLAENSLILSDTGLGDTRWTHQYLGTCPYCEDRYPWLSPLAEEE